MDIKTGRIELASLPGLLDLIEKVLLDLSNHLNTLNPRLKSIGGAEKANSLPWDLILLRELVVGTSSSSLLSSYYRLRGGKEENFHPVILVCFTLLYITFTTL
jgi:hypothetical protein